MREEDIDWDVYHRIIEQKECTLEQLQKITGYDSEILEISLSHLERYLLIENNSGKWRACQLQEIILKNELKDLLCDGIEFSGGLIRYRPQDGKKQE